MTPTRFLALFVLLLPGLACARNWAPLKQDTIVAAQPRTLALVVTTPDGLSGRTARFEYTDAAILTTLLVVGPAGILPLAALIGEEGDWIAKSHKLVDPAAAIGQRLASALSKKYGLATQTLLSQRSSSREAAGRLPRMRNVDLALKVTTWYWQFRYRGTIWGGFKYSHHVRVTLHDVRRGVVLAEGDCVSDEAMDRAGPFDIETLLAEDAAELRRQIDDAVDHCVDHFESRLLFTAASRRPPPTSSPKPATANTGPTDY